MRTKVLNVLMNWNEETWNAHNERCEKEGLLLMCRAEPENPDEGQPTWGIDTRYLPEQPSPQAQAEVRGALEQVGEVDGWKDSEGITWVLSPHDDALEADVALAWTLAMVALGELGPGPAQEPDEHIRRIFGD